MRSSCNYDDLLKMESLRKIDYVDWKMIRRLILRAKKDLQMAKKNLKADEPTALDLVYKSMFHVSNALIRSQGFRPGRVRQHVGVIEAVERTLGVEAKPIVRKFDQLRKKRNEFEYQGLYRGTKTEIINGFSEAEKLIGKIKDYIETKNPQKKLRF